MSAIGSMRSLRHSRPSASWDRVIDPQLSAGHPETAGASREGVSRGLQVLRGLRIIETARRRITVLDFEALARHAHGVLARVTRERPRLHRAV
ncbi:MAG: helix-turn-helix domain-containing protein [Mycobacterium sp.]